MITKVMVICLNIYFLLSKFRKKIRLMNIAVVYNSDCGFMCFSFHLRINEMKNE